jgi:hypothetical protein
LRCLPALLARRGVKLMSLNGELTTFTPDASLHLWMMVVGDVDVRDLVGVHRPFPGGWPNLNT